MDRITPLQPDRSTVVCTTGAVASWHVIKIGRCFEVIKYWERINFILCLIIIVQKYEMEVVADVFNLVN